MSRTNTAIDIIGQSSLVLARHKMLLVFPLLSGVAIFVIFAYFLAPLMFHTTTPELWNTFLHPEAVLEARRAARQGLPVQAPEFRMQDLSFGWVVATYLISVFVATFTNFAFYSQVLQAMNGGRVSVQRGFALALSRLPAIAAWSLFAGTLGAILRTVQDRLPLVGQWITALIGMAGSVASVFVIPVMLNEPRNRNPIDHLRISARLIKRVWGEGLIGIAGMTAAGVFAFVAIAVAMLLLTTFATITLQYWLVSVGVLLVIGCVWLMECIMGIFRCGLYIYATEGVAPGPFDSEIFQRVWNVKDRSPQP